MRPPLHGEGGGGGYHEQCGKTNNKESQWVHVTVDNTGCTHIVDIDKTVISSISIVSNIYSIYRTL